MKKTILITGATDGIGLVTAKLLAKQGHDLLIHGRSSSKLDDVAAQLSTIPNHGKISHFVADLSDLNAVVSLGKQVSESVEQLDVLINNAGVFKVPQTITAAGYDVRFVVNTIAPYLLTLKLSDVLHEQSRVVSLASAAQAPVDVDALLGKSTLDDMPAYAQSKLALIMWNNALATRAQEGAPVYIAVNPGSLLASKMVKQGFGVAGNDLEIGAKVLAKMALDESVAEHSGEYFDNDAGHFSPPHIAGTSSQNIDAVMAAIDVLTEQYL